MNTEVSTTDFRQTFRDTAAGHFHEAADMSLHGLVDEFVRLTEIIEQGTTREAGGGYNIVMNDTAQLAFRVRRVIDGAAKSRFGITFSSYDRNLPGDDL